MASITERTFADRLAGAAPLVIALACALVYLNSLNGPFIFDDVSSLNDNPTIGHLWPLTDLLNPPANTTVGGRPVVNATLALNFALGGYRPFGYHLLNLAIHLFAALTLFGVVRRAFASLVLNRGFEREEVAVALAVALLWGVHPLQTESVTYMIQRCESLGALFYLLTLYCFQRGVGGGGGMGWLALSVLSCAFGMGTKETMVSAPLAVLLYDRTFEAGSFATAFKARWRYYLALGLTWVILGYLVATGGDRVGTAGFGVGFKWWEYGLTQIYSVTMYLKLAFLPWPLVLDYGETLHPLTWDIIPRAILLLALLAFTVKALIENSPWGFVGAVFFMVLAPTSSIVSIRTQTAAEHRMYLPLASVVIASTLAIRHWWKKRGPMAGAASLVPVAAVGAVGVALGAATVARNMDYRSEYGMLLDTERKNPGNHRVQETLALYRFQDGEIEKALKSFDEAQRLKPEPEKDVRLAIDLLRQDHPAAAEALMRHGIGRGNPTARQFNMLGIVLSQQGKNAEAVRYFRFATQLAPESENYRQNLARALAAAGMN